MTLTIFVHAYCMHRVLWDVHGLKVKALGRTPRDVGSSPTRRSTFPATFLGENSICNLQNVMLLSLSRYYSTQVSCFLRFFFPLRTWVTRGFPLKLRPKQEDVLYSISAKLLSMTVQQNIQKKVCKRRTLRVQMSSVHAWQMILKWHWLLREALIIIYSARLFKISSN